jgi:hypothetical protein
MELSMASYSGLWDGVYNEAYALQVNRPAQVRAIGRVLKRRSSTRLREVIDTVAAGSSINGAAAVTRKQIAGTVDPGNPVVQGGSVTIETITQIAAAQTTSAGDASTVDDEVAFLNKPSSYPADAAGNGGGGKSAGFGA